MSSSLQPCSIICTNAIAHDKARQLTITATKLVNFEVGLIELGQYEPLARRLQLIGFSGLRLPACTRKGRSTYFLFLCLYIYDTTLIDLLLQSIFLEESTGRLISLTDTQYKGAILVSNPMPIVYLESILYLKSTYLHLQPERAFGEDDEVYQKRERDDRGAPVPTRYYICCVKWSDTRHHYLYNLKLEPSGTNWIKRGKHEWFRERFGS